jgi:hypothetical protein
MSRHPLIALAASALVTAGLVLAAPAHAAQGGWDRDHAWIKISRAESVKPNGKGGFDQRFSGCPGISDRNQCNRLILGVQREFLANPARNVGGYWAEYFPKGDRLRSGVW